MASARKVMPYGTWTSPITSAITSGKAKVLAELMVDPRTKDVYVVENRPAEKGRGVIVRTNGKESVDVLPEQFSAKAKIHGGTGGATSMCPDGRMILTDANTGGVLTLSPDGEVEIVVPASEDTKVHYADFSTSPIQPHLILALKEVHHDNGEVLDTIDVIDTRTKTSRVVIEGADFYSHPRFSPDGKNICWTQWSHPDMPWTGSQLYVADWVNDEVVNKIHIAGKPLQSAVCQPRWGPDGVLWFVDEPDGFWQLHRYSLTSRTVEKVLIEEYEEADMGKAEWGPGNSTYGFLDQDTLVIVFTKAGATGVIIYSLTTNSVTELPLELAHVEWNGIKCISSTSFAVIGGTAKTPTAVYLVDITRPTEKQLLRSSIAIDLPLETFSPAQNISFPRTHGSDRSRPSHAIFVPPHNPSFEAPAGSLPPLIINIHGGPTANVPPALIMETQYFTSRGYAYAAINYAGSTGYGRAYRDDLNHSWGIKDVEDTLSCIDYLASQNLIDRQRVAIRGGSAGGYTVFQALSCHPNVFAAGCSLYGVADLKKLMDMTHKFESHYGFNLLFPSNASEGEKAKVYRERSPLFHYETIESPLLLFQGTEDVVVPMQQSVEMERVLREAGKDVSMIIFEGEGHGFYKEETLKRRIEAEEALYARTLIA